MKVRLQIRQEQRNSVGFLASVIAWAVALIVLICLLALGASL